MSALRSRTSARVAAVASVAVTGALLLAAPGSAAVKGVTAGTPSRACPAPTYPTIQAAVDAALPGAVIKVCPGSYVENVHVNTPNVTLISGTTAAATTVTGTGLDLKHTPATIQVNGVGDAVKHLTVAPDPTSGLSIETDNTQTDPAVGARVAGNVITGNLLVGSGSATVRNNQLSNAFAQPSGISAFGAHVDISGNVLRPNGNTTGIYVWNSTGSVASNIVQGAGASGAGIVVAYSPGFTVGPDNQVSRDGYGIEAIGDGAIITQNAITTSGYGLYANGARNNTFSGNDVSGSTSYDCYDASGGSLSMGTANAWTANVGQSSWHSGICTPAGA